jgi:cell division protein FtsB
MWVQIPPSALAARMGCFDLKGIDGKVTVDIGRSSVLGIGLATDYRGVPKEVWALAGCHHLRYDRTEEAMDESKKPFLTRLWVPAAILIGILILGDLSGRMTEARRLEQDAIQLRTVVAEQAAENQQLQTQIAEADTDWMVEQWARREAKMVRPGERLVIPIPAPDTIPTPMATPAPTHPTPSYWDVWWTFLFGG